MAVNIETKDEIIIPEAPSIPGLRFRRFRGDEDFPRMIEVVDICWREDENDPHVAETVEVLRENYKHLQNSNPATDMVFIEVEGEPNDGVVGYSRMWWWQVVETGERVYASFGYILPQWRRKGIGRAVLKQNQRRLMEIAAEHPRDGERKFGAFAGDHETGTNALLQGDGYQIVTYGASMVRPHLNEIEDLPLPEGVEVRPVEESQLRQIWEADVEAFRDHWGFAEPGEEGWQEFITFPHTDHSLWRVAWSGDQVVGMVRSFINQNENEQLNRKRGYTEFISVRRPWRRMGVARALIHQSLQALKDRGMEEAALGVHVENPNGAFKLYESCGFRVVRMNNDYRKPMG